MTCSNALRNDFGQGVSSVFATRFSNAAFARLMGEQQASMLNNVVFSPLTYMLTTGMYATASNGGKLQEVASQLERCTGCGTLQRGWIERSIPALANRFGNEDWDGAFGGCSVWTDDGADSSIVNEALPNLARLSDVFGSETYGVHLGTPDAPARMNEWASSMTGAASGFDISARPGVPAFLMAAVGVRASWQTPFNSAETVWGDFPFEDSSSWIRAQHGDARFMRQHLQSHGYFKGGGFTRVSLPFSNGFRMDVAIPSDDDGSWLPGLLSDPEIVELAFGSADNRSGDICLALPRFEVVSAVHLGSISQRMGLQALLERFPRTMRPGRMRFPVSMRGCAAIRVNEAGIGSDGDPRPLEETCLPACECAGKLMAFNRPFAFRIVTGSGFPLLMGMVERPCCPPRERFLDNPANVELVAGAGDVGRVRYVSLHYRYSRGGDWQTVVEDGRKTSRRGLFGYVNENGLAEVELSGEAYESILRRLKAIGVFGWEEWYEPARPYICDGKHWYLEIGMDDGSRFVSGG